MQTRLSSTAVIRIAIMLAILVGAATLISAPNSPYKSDEKAAFADEKTVNFVRPGLVVRILSAEIASDGTMKTKVRFTDPAGVPLDRDGIETPGVIGSSVIAAYIPKGQSHRKSYGILLEEEARPTKYGEKRKHCFNHIAFSVSLLLWLAFFNLDFLIFFAPAISRESTRIAPKYNSPFPRFLFGAKKIMPQDLGNFINEYANELWDFIKNGKLTKEEFARLLREIKVQIIKNKLKYNLYQNGGDPNT